MDTVSVGAAIQPQFGGGKAKGRTVTENAAETRDYRW